MPQRRPKKILTWRYDDGAGTTMEIPVYQVTKYDGIWLRVVLPELDIREEIRPKVLKANARRLLGI